MGSNKNAFVKDITTHFRDGRDFIKVERPLDTNIRTEFVGGNDNSRNNSRATGNFGLHHNDHNLTIESRQENLNTKEIYRYLLFTGPYILSPVPMQMLDIAPNETARLTRKITFRLG